MAKKSNIEPGRVTKRHADRRNSRSESNKICHSEPIDGFPNKLFVQMANMIRCIAVDDESLALNLLSDYIGQIPDLNLIEATDKVLDALSLIQQDKVDLVFLDIQMPELTGMQFLRLINGKCKAILTTAYPQYALEGYEYDVLDYLVKPISFERFAKAVNKAGNYISEQPVLQPVESVVEAPKNTEMLDFIFVKVEHKIKKVNLPDILYIEGLKDYVSVYTASERILTLQTMKKMEELLPPQRFIRVHKSYIVALDKIDYIEKQRIFIGKTVIPLGDTYKDDFMKLL